MSAANAVAAILARTSAFQRGLQYARSLKPEDIESDPLILALLVAGTVDGIPGISERERDMLARVIGCLIIDWSKRIDGHGDEAVQILLSCQDAEQLVAKAMRKAAND